MARVGINDELHADRRFKALVRSLGGDEDRAVGMLYRFWRHAQDCWARGELVPLAEFEADGLGPVLECGLAVLENGEVRAIGSENHFEWYRQRKVAGRKSASLTRKRKSVTTDEPRKEHEPGTDEPPISITTSPLPLRSAEEVPAKTNLPSELAALAPRLPLGAYSSLVFQFSEPFLIKHLRDAVAYCDAKEGSALANLKTVQRYLKIERDKPPNPFDKNRPVRTIAEMIAAGEVEA